MPSNKGFNVRIQALNECFRSKHTTFWSKEALIDFLREKRDIEVSERTIIEDIRLMRHCTQLRYHAPIIYVKKENGYCYSDQEFSINKLPLNSSDINALTLAAATLNQYKQVAALTEFTSVIDKVVSVVQNIEHTKDQVGYDFIDFEKAPFVKGNEHLSLLIEAIRSKKVIEISYVKFENGIPDLRIISPYLLKEYRNRWYLIGLQHSNLEIRTFGLDRIQSLRINEGFLYLPNEGINADTYFKNSIGVSFQKGRVEEVILSFTARDGNYIKTQHLHRSQQVLIDSPEELRIKLLVVVNYELVSTILSFGKEVRVLSPKSLIDQIVDHIEGCNRLYESCDFE